MARPLNALIVEDSTTIRKMIMKALGQTGLADFTFTEAENGVDALVKYSPTETEIIFVDMNMPKMGGIELIRTIRSQYQKSPPTVMITAETDKETILGAINEPGVDAFLLKPVDRDRLQTGLRKLVDSIPAREGPCIVPYGECVSRAAHEILAEACKLGISVEPENPEIRRGKVVLGMIALHGSVHWSVVMGFTRDSATAIASRFAGYEIGPDGPDIGDAIGELLHMVGGRIKKLLSAESLTVNLSLPTVLGVSEFAVLLRPRSTVDYVHYDSEVGKFWTMLSVGVDAGTFL